MSEPYYQMKLVANGGVDLGEHLNELGREGWHIAGVTEACVFLQRLVQDDDAEAEKPLDYIAAPDEEIVDPLCGCGCGESVEIGISAWQLAIDRGTVWYLGGHGVESDKHDGKPYAAAPRRLMPMKGSA